MPTDSATTLLTGGYIAQVKSRGGEYIADTDTVTHIRELATALTASKPRNGFLLCGPCGNGKTTLLYAFQTALNFLRSAQGMSCLVAGNEGIRIVDAHDLANMARMNTEAFTATAETPLLAIEDLGKEAAEVSSYGNIINPIAEIIERRYDKQLFTAITSNLAPRMISEKYGARVADRFREMLDVIVFENGSYRK